METANLPPVHATGSGQTEHRKTGPLLRMQHSTLVGCSSRRRRRRRQLFRCCFYNKPNKTQETTNSQQQFCNCFVRIYWLPCLGSSARLRSTSDDDQLINKMRKRKKFN
jgi:hypothetical protein